MRSLHYPGWRGRQSAVNDDARHVIPLRLSRPEEMFELSQSDLFSDYRNFQSGVDYCISELRSRSSHVPVLLDIELPASEMGPDTPDQISRTLRRYCDHRLSYNRRERQAVRIDGLSALRVGIPVAMIGLLVAILVARQVGLNSSSGIVVDTAGWVLAWVGLWYPLDTLIFTPLPYGRESRVLELLGDAEVMCRPRRPVGPTVDDEASPDRRQVAGSDADRSPPSGSGANPATTHRPGEPLAP
jgi:hypothetical protein